MSQQPDPTHERPGQPAPQPIPVPAPREHPTDTLPRRIPGGSL
ncbi:hypothetical protein [Streptomyces sp. NBC_01614]